MNDIEQTTERNADVEVKFLNQKVAALLGNIDALETETLLLKEENQTLAGRIEILENILKQKAQ